MTASPADQQTLSIVVCGAGPAAHVRRLVELAHARQWTVAMIATPSALPFLDVAELEQLTGSPVRSEYRQPSGAGGRVLPISQAVIVAPATYNTICKLALGISDTYPLGVLAEAIGARTPLVILPFVNSALAARAPFLRAVESLRAENVHILLGRAGWTPHQPGTGSDLVMSFPWSTALDIAESAIRAQSLDT